MNTNIHANFNHVSPSIFAKLAVLAEADGIDLEEYHEQILARWIQFPTKLSESSSSENLSERQKKLPDINEPTSHNQAFIEQLMAIPKLEGYEDIEIFPRANSTATIPDFSE